MWYQRWGKRIFDIISASLLLLALAPVMLATAVAVRFAMGRPVIFRQRRPGRNEKIFIVLKFRTMLDRPGIKDEERLTHTGRLLRKTSLDELPQLLNILRGQMSFIGPRPLAEQYLKYYSDEERVRHTVRPGITGLAQIRGRNSLTWEERFAFDLEYVANISLMNDLRIAIATIKKILDRTDVITRGDGSIGDFDQHRRDQKTSTKATLPTIDRSRKSE